MFFFSSRQVKSQTKQTNCCFKPVENILQILSMEPPCFIKSLIDCLEMKKDLSSGKKYIFLHMAAEEFTFPPVRSFELPLQTQMQISLCSHLTHSLSLLSYEVCCIWLLYEESSHAGFFTPLQSDRHKFNLTTLSKNWYWHTHTHRPEMGILHHVLCNDYLHLCLEGRGHKI